MYNENDKISDKNKRKSARALELRVHLVEGHRRVTECVNLRL